MYERTSATLHGGEVVWGLRRVISLFGNLRNLIFYMSRSGGLLVMTLLGLKAVRRFPIRDLVAAT